MKVKSELRFVSIAETNNIWIFAAGHGTVMVISFRTDKSGQTVQTQIRLLLEEQSDQGLHFSLFHWHLLD